MELPTMNDSSTWTLSTLNDARSSVELVDRQKNQTKNQTRVDRMHHTLKESTAMSSDASQQLCRTEGATHMAKSNLATHFPIHSKALSTRRSSSDHSSMNSSSKDTHRRRLAFHIRILKSLVMALLCACSPLSGRLSRCRCGWENTSV